MTKTTTKWTREKLDAERLYGWTIQDGSLFKRVSRVLEWINPDGFTLEKLVKEQARLEAAGWTKIKFEVDHTPEHMTCAYDCTMELRVTGQLKQTDEQLDAFLVERQRKTDQEKAAERRRLEEQLRRLG